ncbi:MAG: hypothetical protein ACYC4L_04760 [Chloroflexota bacterium]
MAKWKVSVSLTAYADDEIEVEAPTQAEAERKAKEEAHRGWGLDWEVESVDVEDCECLDHDVDEETGEPIEPPEYVKMAALGVPMMPGFEYAGASA